MVRTKYKKFSIYLLLLLLISFYSVIAVNFQEIRFNRLNPKPNNYDDWNAFDRNADKNNNGISDDFEPRLKILSEVGFIEENLDQYNSNIPQIDFPSKNVKTNTVTITSDAIPIIVSFPKGDFKYASSFFEELGGTVNHKYSMALNGFAGRTDYIALNKFCETLRESNIPFLLEEDRIYHANLYFTSRNMNLRPYVWDTLSYRGDPYSSIAIIDTGIDDSHNFFIPGYSNGDSSYKIVGWRDVINSLSSPYDDNGHGSHCGGIAAGIGSPNYDGNGRSVATAAYSFNYTGINLPEQEVLFDWTRFRVNTTGVIEMNCEFDDYTPGSDDAYFWAYLYYEGTPVASYIDNSSSWSHTLSFTVTTSDFGDYSFMFMISLVDNTGDGYCSDFDVRFRNQIHWPFDPALYGSGDAWQGIAPDANLVGIKVLDQQGGGWSSDIIDGIDWAIANKMTYNITTISLSLGGSAGDTSFINAVNNAVENGIVTVVSAGNDGPGYNSIGSPGDADNVITVAAMSIDDEITSYSSQGGTSYTGNTIKPDITAPGGSFYNVQMFSTDTNDNDAEGVYPSDVYANDMMGAQGTSMSAPAVAGASNLLIEAMGGHESWGYTATEAKKVKALLLMSATETYPLLRETYDPSYSPLLNRGGKDAHEGYGRLNVDVAIEAYTQELTSVSDVTAYLSSSSINPFDKHALGCYVDLIEGEHYLFTLDIPGDADFDLHLYNSTPTSIGEPIMVAQSTSTNIGDNEAIEYTATETGRYYLIAKAISGEGNAVISYLVLDHNLKVSLEVPNNPDIYDSYIVKATVLNNGQNSESDIDLYLYLDDVIVNSTTIPSLSIDVNETINYIWTPTEYRTYNFTAYASPVPAETYTADNTKTNLILIMQSIFFDDFESGLTKWQSITGLWHLTDTGSAWPDPCHSPTHAMWFGNESTGNYDTGFQEYGELISIPFSLADFDTAYLEFYHWREGEGSSWDMSFVYISTNGIDWDEIYSSDATYIAPWERVSLNLSGYVGYSSVQLMFYFDTIDSAVNDYRGWLVDDVQVKGVESPSLTISIPDNLSLWETGTSEDITWTSTDSISDVKIELYKEGAFLMEIVASTPNDGSYTWVIPSGLDDSAQYQIKISDVSNFDTYDFSDNFEIFNPMIMITTPDNTNSWEAGTSHYIYWTSTGVISDIRIELYRSNVFLIEIILITPNDGEYYWTVPSGLDDSPQYQIKIIDVSNPSTYDYSDYFEIKPPTIPGYNFLILITIIGIYLIFLIKNSSRKELKIK